MSNKSVFVPFLLIAVGVGWLLTAHAVIPGVNWIWILSLGMVGILVLAVGGFDKLTVVVGPFLIACSFFSLLRQIDKISINTEVPFLVITGGVFMLIPYLVSLPNPGWYHKPEPSEVHRPSKRQHRVDEE